MSVRLRLPSQFIPALTDFVQLPAEEREVVLRLFKEGKPSLDLGDISQRVADHSAISADKARRLVDLIINFNGAREYLGLTEQEFVDQLHSAMEATGNEALHPPDWAEFEKAIVASMAGDSALALTSKAATLMREHANVFFSARVVTDLRPVFSTDLDSEPAALIALHTLKINYDSDQESREFFVALERTDVEELIEVLQRCLKKEESLRRLVTEKGLTILEVAQ